MNFLRINTKYRSDIFNTQNIGPTFCIEPFLKVPQEREIGHNAFLFVF